MSGPAQEHVIRNFGPVSVLKDSTETEPKVSIAQNVRLRPVGSITGPPIYQRLAQIGNSAFVDAIYFALTYTPFGGSPRALVRASDKTIAIMVSTQGENYLVLYSLNTRKTRGLFNLGNDGTFNGTPDFVNGTAVLTVIAVGLDDNARWHGAEYYNAWHIGNGVDANVIVQLSRKLIAPGIWRLAGSNQSPASAILRQVVPTSATQVQASWTIPGTNRNNFDANIFVTVTANVATDTFTKVSTTASPALTHGMFVNDPVWINPGGLGGVTAATVYYVIASGLTTNAFKVSATIGGSAVNLTGAGTNIGVQSIGKVYAFGHTFKANDAVKLTTEVQLPDFLPTGGVIDTATTYYIVNPTTDQVGLSPTIGGSAIEINTPGVGISQIVAIATTGNRLGKASLTFTADARNFPGSIGDNIYVSITYLSSTPSTGVVMVGSTLMGSGTVSDPYHYSLYTTSGASATQAIVDFVNNDTNATGIIIASASSVDTNEDGQSWAFHELTGGIDSTLVNGLAVGFSDKTCTMFLRYWDVGVDHIGYEGISSQISNTVTIDALSNYLIQARIATNPSVESSRFGFIRAYFQFGEDVQAQWNLVAEVPNTGGTFTSGFESPIAITSINISSDTFNNRLIPPLPTFTQLQSGDVIKFNSTGAFPAPIVANINYYVVNANSTTFQVSLTQGGSPINITSVGSGTVTARRVQIAYVSNGATMDVNDVVQFTGAALPPGIQAATDYYVVRIHPDSTSAITIILVSLIMGGYPLDFFTVSAPPTLQSSTVTVVAKSILIGVETPVGQVMQVDQNRPLPSTLKVISGGNVWHGGVTSQPSRLYPSKQAVFDELYPEGANSLAYEIVRFPASVSSPAVTALYTDDTNLYVHSAGAIVYFPPSTPDARIYPRVFSGAAAPSCLATWTRNRIQYLGANLELFEQVQSQITPLQSDFLALDAGAYIRNLTDLNAFASSPDRTFMFSDERGQILWFWVPGLDGNLIGFAYDQLSKGVTGPFTYPKVYSMIRMEVGRPEYIFADEVGNLFIWNSAVNYDFDGSLPTNATPTVHTLGSAATTPSEQGFESTPVTGGEYWRSSTIIVETGFLDMSKPGQRKHFLALLFTSVQNSRAIATVTFTDKAGRAVSVAFGDIYRKAIRDVNKVLIGMADTAVKIKLQLVTSEMNPVQVRDFTMQWRSQGQI